MCLPTSSLSKRKGREECLSPTPKGDGGPGQRFCCPQNSIASCQNPHCDCSSFSPNSHLSLKCTLVLVLKFPQMTPSVLEEEEGRHGKLHFLHCPQA